MTTRRAKAKAKAKARARAKAGISPLRCAPVEMMDGWAEMASVRVVLERFNSG
jgi:hypothetical protein